MLRRASFTVLAIVLLPATVQAFDHHEHHHDYDSEGDGGGCSSKSTHASSTPTPSPTVTATPSPSSSSSNKRVFVTSTVFSGAIGGLAAADMYCQSAATAGGLTGTFHAWLSDASQSAVDRTADVGPWYTTGNAVAFPSKAELRGAPQAELLDERGAYPQSLLGAAWTGSDVQGAATSETCEGWTNATVGATATTGSGFNGDASWGGGGAPLPCNAQAPLICFQQ
jgi:hypothetical protein